MTSRSDLLNGDNQVVGRAVATSRAILGGAFPTSIVYYKDESNTVKVFEIVITRDATQNPTSVDYKLYSLDGQSVVSVATERITYSGPFEVGRTRTISP